MPKKFINPNWKALRKLSHELREAWFYCWDKADAAGVYEYDPEYMRADLGFELSFEELLGLPSVKTIAVDKLLFTNYLEVTDSRILKAGYNPHKPIFRAINFSGPENFMDLDLKIESGVKEEKKIESLETFFKLENKKTKLENNFSKLVSESDSGSGSDSEADEEGMGGEELLVPQMLAIWKKKKPDYPHDRQKDFTALRHIAVFVCKQSAISFQPREPDVKDRVLEAWERLVAFIAQDNFYNSKSLTSVSFNIQSISMSIQNGNSKTSKGGAGKVTGAGLHEALAKFRGKEQTAGGGG